MIAELLFSVLFCWGMVTFAHELSHLIMGYLAHDLKPKGFWPFWHWHNPKTDDWKFWNPLNGFKDPYKGKGNFYFGRYRSEGKYPRHKHAMIHVAPLITDVCIGVVAFMSLVSATHVVFPAVLLAFCGVDAMVWLKGYFFGGKKTDGYRYRHGDK